MDKNTIIKAGAHLKVIMTYGAENAYPFITAFTAVGVAKLAFGIPAWMALILMVAAVFGVGLFMFKVGLFSQDLDIKWRKTPSAMKLCEAVERIEEKIKK